MNIRVLVGVRIELAVLPSCHASASHFFFIVLFSLFRLVQDQLLVEDLPYALKVSFEHLIFFERLLDAILCMLKGTEQAN